MDNHSYLSNANGEAIEALYDQYKSDPESVDFGWRKFFEGFDFQRSDYSSSAISENMLKEFKVINLITGYRTRGHLFTKTNPVRARRTYLPTLDIEHFGLTKADLNETFQAGEEIGIGPSTLQQIIDHLKETYCESIGVEYMYIREPERVQWVRNKIELKNRPTFLKEEKLRIFRKLSQASIFEQFLQKKFVGQKRFSVEGGEGLIPAVDAIVDLGAKLGAKEFVMGMAHRGRLNILSHIFGKDYAELFVEFEGKEFDEKGEFDGDVKYHLGHSCDVISSGGQKVHLTLAPNPSHLEAVDPIVEGITRAKIDHYLGDENSIVPILIHGDAAISGQGVVYEVVQMAQLDGYRTGGTIHLVVNNQVGFTTNYLDGRSSTYCTDVAKTTLCPVFHVNADDVEAIVQTVKIAMEYRQHFHRDVFIDLLGYRKYGHNEGDEPKFTQPKLYKAIASHKPASEIYLDRLIEEGTVDKSYGEAQRQEVESALNEAYDRSKDISTSNVMHFLEETWKDYRAANEDDFLTSPETGVSIDRLRQLGERLATLPEGKKYFRKTEKLMEDRANMLAQDVLDWGMGESLAYASLLDEGHPVRISGQDVERGTFSHRHAVIKTEDSEEEVVPLSNLSDGQAKFSIYNSSLSEYGVLGFDYGYAFATPHGLTVWEAQFGDFFNGAQIIIDQFISAAEDKWRTMNGLVMLLPHGYEGMGSEHSSGRIERFLQLAAENNIQICNVTTPANFFHLLRRQMNRPFRKPLIVFSPKKLLRYPKAVSSLAEMANGRFQELFDDPSVKQGAVDTVVFCSGKVYYEFLEEREKTQSGENIAVVRLEQLYPLPLRQMEAIVEKYGKKCRYIWMQEEPENMGAWSFILRKFRMVALEFVGLQESGSPAAGSPRVSESRQKAMLNSVFKYAKIKA